MLMLQLSQQFPAPGSQGAREDARLARAKAEDAMADDRARLVARDAAHAFADWAEAAERCRIHDEHVRVAGAVLAAAEARIAGGGKLTDVAQARVALQRVQADAATDRARLAAAASRVAALMERPMDAPLGTPVLGEAQVPSQPPSELAKQARAARPELRAVRALVESSERDETAAKREALWPELEVGLAYNPATTPMPFHGYGVSLSMTLPWLWGAASSRRDATRAREQAARLEADAARLPIDAEIATAAGAARAAGTKLRLLRERVLPASRESFELVLAGYASGGTEIRDVLDARRARIDTEEEIVMARAELEHALADLEAAVGAPLALAPLSTLPLDETEAANGR
jgi:outer membrane protein TolC